LLAWWARQTQTDIDEGSALQPIFEAVLGEAADVLIQKQPDNRGEFEGCLFEGVVVRESTDWNIEVGNDTRDVIVDWYSRT
jgi:hypothetical protein